MNLMSKEEILIDQIELLHDEYGYAPTDMELEVNAIQNERGVEKCHILY